MPPGADGREQMMVTACVLADMSARIETMSGQLAAAVAAAERRKSEVVTLCREIVALHERYGAPARGVAPRDNGEGAA